MAQELTFVRTSGNVPRTPPNQDHVSALVLDFTNAGYSVSSELYNGRFASLEDVAAANFANDGTVSGKIVDYHLRKAFEINPGSDIVLWASSVVPFTNVLEFILNNTTDIRQAGVYIAGAGEDISTHLDFLQSQADIQYEKGAPVSFILASGHGVLNYDELPAYNTGYKNISLSISESQDDDCASLRAEAGEPVTDIGIMIGLVSKAAVHESVAWVKKFNSGIQKPGLVDGSDLIKLSTADLQGLDSKGYLFFKKYPGISGSYLNDSHTLAEPTSEFSKIEAVRTMDKVERGIRTYLTPYLGAPLYVDAETGKLRPDTVAFIETLAGRQLEDMEKAGELSGYKVEVDPNQNVLSTSTVEIIVKQVAVGVMRRVNVKLSYTTKID